MLFDAEWKEAGDEYTRFKETDSKGDAGRWKTLRLTAAENKPPQPQNDAMECPIRLHEILPKDASLLNCKHTFCKQCITAWIKKNPSCPHCRAPQSQQK